MGKLAVVFFAALAVQAAFGHRPVSFGSGPEELEALVHQIGKVSDHIYDTLQASAPRRGFTWKGSSEFGPEIDAIISYCEELANQHATPVSGAIFSVLRELREIHSYFSQLRSANDRTVRELEIGLGMAIKRIAKHMDSFVRLSAEEPLSRSDYSDVKSTLERFMFALERLYNAHDFDESTDMYATDSRARIDDIREITRRLVLTLKPIDFDSVPMKRTFVHLIREYLDNLTKYTRTGFHEYYHFFFRTETHTHSVQEMKTKLMGFINTYVDNVSKMEEVSRLAYLRASDRFYSRLNIMQEVNTPVRHLVLRIHTLTDMLTMWYEITPEQSSVVKSSITEHSRHFATKLEHFVSGIRGGNDNDAPLVSWKRIISRLENNWNQRTLIVSIQEAATVLHKLLMLSDEEVALELGGKFFQLLESQVPLLYQLCERIHDVELWTTYLMTMTNKMSIYFHGEAFPEDMEILMGTMGHVFEILNGEGHGELSATLKNIVEEYKAEHYPINTFLHKISLEMVRSPWSYYARSGTFPGDAMDVINPYLRVIEEIHRNHRVAKGLLVNVPPSEITMKIQKEADRLTDILGIIVPGFKRNSMYYRGHYFQQLLEIVIFGLQEANYAHEGPNELVHGVYENLRKIHSDLVSDLKQNDIYFKVKLGIYVQDTVYQLKNLAFGNHLEKHAGFVIMYGDFLFGLKQMVNDVQSGLQIVLADYSVSTLGMQIASVADHLSGLLQRVQLKPELKRAVLTQTSALACFVEWLVYDFEKTPGSMGFSAKYRKIHDELIHITKTGSDKSVEELCTLLDTHVKDIIADLERLPHTGYDSTQLYLVYQYTLETLSNIMIRFDNVHHYEYYKNVINNHDFLGLMKKFSTAAAAKLQRTLADRKGMRYDLGILIWRYIYNLQNVVMRFQIEAGVFPKDLYDVIFGLINAVRGNPASVNEFDATIAKYILDVVPAMEKMLAQESYVLTKNGFVKYMETIEVLYINIEHILARSAEPTTLRQLTNHVYTNIFYLTKTLEYITGDDKIAFEILSTKFRRLVDFVTVMSEKLREMVGFSSKFEHVFKRLTEFEPLQIGNGNTEELKIKMGVYLHHISLVLREMTWTVSETEHDTTTALVPRPNGVQSVFHNMFYEFLMTVQRLDVEIGREILVNRRRHNLNKWGLLKSDGDSYFAKRYGEDATLPKYLSNFGKNYGTEYLSQFYSGGYRPKYGFTKISLGDSGFDGNAKDRYSYEGGHDTNNDYEYQSFPSGSYYTSGRPGYFGSAYLAAKPNPAPSNGGDYFTNKYDQNYYGTFTKYFSDHGKKFYGTFDKDAAYGSKFGTSYQSGYDIFHKVYGGEYEPKYGFHGYFNKVYQGHFTGGNGLEKQYPAYNSGMNAEYFGKSSRAPGGHRAMDEYASPEYFTRAEDKVISALVDSIKTTVGEVTRDLLSSKSQLKRDSVVYVQQLVQILDNIIDRLVQETQFENVITNFKQVRLALQQMYATDVFSQGNRVKYLVVNSIEKVAAEFEQIYRIAERDDVLVLKDIFVQFFSYVRNLKFQIRSDAFGGNNSEGYNTGYIGQPWFYAH